MVVAESAFEELGGFRGREGRASAVPPTMRLLELSSEIIVPETVTWEAPGVHVVPWIAIPFGSITAAAPLANIVIGLEVEVGR